MLELSFSLCDIPVLRHLLATSFPGPFPWLAGGAQGKGPGNEIDLSVIGAKFCLRDSDMKFDQLVSIRAP